METVSVGCKLPWGLICEMGKPGEESYKRVTLVGSNGANQGHTHMAGGVPPAHVLAHGYGITFGVPKDFMDAWMAKHARLDAVRNGLIFVEAAKDAPEMAKAFEEQKTGFEPMIPNTSGKGLVQSADSEA